MRQLDLLQDLAIKFFEAMNAIAGASLENSTWFRRNVAVLPNVDRRESEDNGVDGGPMPSPPPTASLQSRNSQYSINALCFMAEVSINLVPFTVVHSIYSWVDH